MDVKSVFLHSKAMSSCVGFTSCHSFSLRPFNEHLPIKIKTRYPLFLQDQLAMKTTLNCSFAKQFLPTQTRAKIHLLQPLNCSFSNITSPESQNPFLKPLKNLSFDSLKAMLFKLTPYDVIKWSAVLSIVIAATKWTLNWVFNPFFWMYFSWAWMFWPGFAAIALGVYGLYCLRKHSLGEANIFEQIAIVTSVFTWLTLVPPACFNGFLEGWPFVFFFVYHYFFFFNVSVRKRLYGDYYVRPYDPKWNVKLPKWQTLLFCVGLMVGHFLAAFEGPELHLIPGGWSNVGIWVLILVTLLMQYNSTLYLANYSEKVVVPSAVVQFGPYRWVRHPIYASLMLLFSTYCIALRAPLSMLFLGAVCVLYYEQKAKREEALLIETFGDVYLDYASKVRGLYYQSPTALWSSKGVDYLTGPSITLILACTLDKQGLPSCSSDEQGNVIVASTCSTLLTTMYGKLCRDFLTHWQSLKGKARCILGQLKFKRRMNHLPARSFENITKKPSVG